MARNLPPDAFGRPYQVERKVPVAPRVQWRWTQTPFSASNLVDSIRTIQLHL
ncbi:MAG: hypothetical protein IPF77_17765 [Gemmatimonadetes bacterium]|nr:hypothetical protein [Gemmatimonadota bacterium]